MKRYVRWFRTFFHATVLTGVLLFGADWAFSQTGNPGAGAGGARDSMSGTAKNERAYVSEKFRFSIVPPKGFVALSEEATRAIVLDRRKHDKIPGAEESDAQTMPIRHTIFQPKETDLSGRRLMVVAEYPPWKSLEEFEKSVTPDTGNLVYHDRQTLNIRRRPFFLLDRSYDLQNTRIRTLCVYVPDYTRQGFLITFASLDVDFDEYRDTFMKSLKTFHVIPPEVPQAMKEARYAGKGLRKKKVSAAWRSPEVILSLVFVAFFAIWFLVKRLSMDTEEGEEESSAPEG